MEPSKFLKLGLFLIASGLWGDPVMVLESEPGTDLLKAGPLVIESLPTGASVHVRGVHRGQTPFTLETLPPGVLPLEISAPGYRTQGVNLSLEAGKSYRLKVVLEKSMGYLDLELPGPGRLFGKGSEISPLKDHFYALPSGKYIYNLSVFGYEEKILEIDLEEGQVLRLKPTLDPAPFRIIGLTLWPRVYNPRNPGALGSISALVEVTAPGSVLLTLRSSGGAVLGEMLLEDFTTWSRKVDLQNLAQSLADGTYTLSATGGLSESTLSFQKRADYLLPLLTPPLPTLGGLKFLASPTLPPGAFWLATQANAVPNRPKTWGLSTFGTLGLGAGTEASVGAWVRELAGAELSFRAKWATGAWGFTLDATGEIDLGQNYRWTSQSLVSLAGESLGAGLGGGYQATGTGTQNLTVIPGLEGLFLQAETYWNPGEWGFTAGYRLFPLVGAGNLTLMGRFLLPGTGAVVGGGTSLIWSTGGLSTDIFLETGFFL